MTVGAVHGRDLAAPGPVQMAPEHRPRGCAPGRRPHDTPVGWTREPDGLWGTAAWGSHGRHDRMAQTERTPSRPTVSGRGGNRIIASSDFLLPPLPQGLPPLVHVVDAGRLPGWWGDGDQS